MTALAAAVAAVVAGCAGGTTVEGTPTSTATSQLDSLINNEQARVEPTTEQTVPPVVPSNVTLDDLVAWTADESQKFWEDQGVPTFFTVQAQDIGDLKCDEYVFGTSDAVYCNRDNVIKWLPANLNKMAKKGGKLTAVFTIAHEVGHSVQDSLEIFNGNKLREEGADCFAAAFMAHAGVNVEDINVAIRATPTMQSLDRIEAAQAGYESNNPLVTCMAYQ